MQSAILPHVLPAGDHSSGPVVRCQAGSSAPRTCAGTPVRIWSASSVSAPGVFWVRSQCGHRTGAGIRPPGRTRLRPFPHMHYCPVVLSALLPLVDRCPSGQQASLHSFVSGLSRAGRCRGSSPPRCWIVSSRSPRRLRCLFFSAAVHGSERLRSFRFSFLKAGGGPSTRAPSRQDLRQHVFRSSRPGYWDPSGSRQAIAPAHRLMRGIPHIVKWRDRWSGYLRRGALSYGAVCRR